jgi:hypothetical protein
MEKTSREMLYSPCTKSSILTGEAITAVLVNRGLETNYTFFHLTL